MDVREKLVELMCDALEDGCIGHCNHPPCWKVTHAVDNLIAHGVTVQEWIPVSDPPKKDGRYLVAKKIFNKIIRQEVLSFAKDGRKVDKYDFHRGWKNVWYRYDSEWGYLTIDDVTHWMPLPQPPKGE